MSLAALRIRRPFALVATLITLSFAGYAAAPPARAVVDPGLTTKLSGVLSDSRAVRAKTGAVVLDATTGEQLFSRNGTRAVIPASNTKVLTAAAAMHALGPAYRFKTEVIARAKVVGGTLQGRLYLKGYGDPTTGQADFAALAQQVAAAGIKRVEGRLAVDAGFFDDQRYNPGWRTSYAASYYAAEISALTVAPNADLDSGTVIIRYAAGSAGRPARITTSPAAAADYLTIRNLTTTGARGTALTAYPSRSYGSGTIVVRGRVPLGRSGSALVTVRRPELYAAAVFRRELRKRGITVAGGTVAVATPASGRRVVARDRSMTISDLLVPFLKLSNNMHAEALTKTMAAEATGRPGSWPAGVAVTRSYLARLGVPLDGVALTDGSGLTRLNQLTPRALASTLQRVRREPWFAAFNAALPVAGDHRRMVGGTLRYRMDYDAYARYNARGKTGSLTGVTSLSGYVTGRNGRKYVFALISNYSGATPRPVEDKLVIALARWR